MPVPAVHDGKGRQALRRRVGVDRGGEVVHREFPRISPAAEGIRAGDVQGSVPDFVESHMVVGRKAIVQHLGPVERAEFSVARRHGVGVAGLVVPSAVKALIRVSIRGAGDQNIGVPFQGFIEEALREAPVAGRTHRVPARHPVGNVPVHVGVQDVKGGGEKFQGRPEIVHTGRARKPEERDHAVKLVSPIGVLPGEDRAVRGLVVGCRIVGHGAHDRAVDASVHLQDHVGSAQHLDRLGPLQEHIRWVFNVLVRAVRVAGHHGEGVVGCAADDQSRHAGHGHAGDLQPACPDRALRHDGRDLEPHLGPRVKGRVSGGGPVA